jgi:membrane-bound ClpP family serine protease
MDPVHISDPMRPRLVVLWTALLSSIAVLAAEYSIASPGFHSPYRTAAILMTIALAAFELLGDKRTEVMLVGPAVIFAILPSSS